jgi:HNH endonuclease
MLGMWGSLNLLELAMPNTLIKSRFIAFNLQQGRCIYCELPMWLDNPEAFAIKYNITTKGAALFKCTVEHLLAKQDGGKDIESNIVAACHFCNQKRHNCKTPKGPVSYKHYVSNRLGKGKWNSALITRSHISSNM